MRAPGGGAARSSTTRGSAPRPRSRSPRPTRPCFGGWTPWTSSNGRSPSSATPTRRWRRASRASSSSAACTTPVARRGSRPRSSASPPVDSTSPARRSRSPEGMATFLTGGAADEIASPLEQALARAGAAVENWDTRAALLWVLVATERFDAVGGGARADARRGSPLRVGARPRGRPQHARPAQAAPRRAARGRRCSARRPARPAGGGLRAGARVRGDRPGRGRRRGRRARRGAGAARPAPTGRLARRRGNGAHSSRAWTAAARPGTCRGGARRLRDLPRALRRRRLGHADPRDRLRARALGRRARAPAPRPARPRARAWPTPSWPTCAGSGRRARWGSRCVSPGWRAEATRDFGCSANRLLRCRARPRCSSAPIRWPRSARRCAGPADAPPRASLSPRRSTSPPAAAPDHWRLAARDELKATGARPRRAWRTGVEALTPSELRVARLAAEGRSNREIAHELYVTLKTVEGHLARAYAKLGIEGRGPAAARRSTEKRPGCPPCSEALVASADRCGPHSPADQGGSDGHDDTRGVREGHRHLQRA